MDIYVYLLFGLVVLLTHFIEGITGFGCTVLAMPFVVMLMGIEIAKPVLTLYALLLCTVFVLNNFRQIRWDHYLKMIAILMMGLPIGIMLYQRLPERPLLIALSIFIATVSIRGILISFNIVSERAHKSNVLALISVFVGGIIHGAFSSGGPFVIIYAREKIDQKTQFRGTLCLVWVTLNSVLTLQMISAGAFTPEAIRVGLYGLPFLILGGVIGNIAHNKIEEAQFLKLTYVVLLVSGIFMVF